MLSFAAAVFFLIITPGPGVLSTAGVGAAHGTGPGLRYVAGLFVGNNIVLAAVITGLAAILLSVPGLRWVLMGLSIAYLLYLAGKIAFAGTRIAYIEATSAPGMMAGILLQPINPKAYAVFTTIVGGFNFHPESAPLEIAMKFVIFTSMSFPIHFLWNLIGASLKRLPFGPKGQRAINVGMAISMLLVVALAAYFESVRAG